MHKLYYFKHNKNMEKLYSNYTKNIELIKSELNEREDLILREIKVGNTHFGIFYILGLSDDENLSKLVIKPIIDKKNYPTKNILNTLQKEVLYFGELSQSNTLSDIIDELLQGKAVLIVNNEPTAIVIQSDKHKERAIAEPPTNAVIKGPRSGFVENLKTNLSALKNVLHTKDLKTINLTCGRYTKTSIAINYIEGIADKKVVKEIEAKI